MLKLAKMLIPAIVLVAVPFAFLGCDNMTTEKTKEVTTTTDRNGDKVIKKEETTTTVEKDE